MADLQLYSTLQLGFATLLEVAISMATCLQKNVETLVRCAPPPPGDVGQTLCGGHHVGIEANQNFGIGRQTWGVAFAPPHVTPRSGQHRTAEAFDFTFVIAKPSTAAWP